MILAGTDLTLMIDLINTVLVWNLNLALMMVLLQCTVIHYSMSKDKKIKK